MSTMNNWHSFAGRHQDEEGEDWPLAVGEVTGVRFWRVCSMGCLHPLHVGMAPPWEPGENTASCVMDGTWMPRRGGQQPLRHPVPWEDCACGFYAYFAEDRPSRAMKMMASVLDTPAAVVAGSVRGYGRTLIGDLGFRCEKAEITALFTDPGGPTSYALTRHYPGIPRLRHDEYEEHLGALMRYAPMVSRSTFGVHLGDVVYSDWYIER